MEYVKYVFRLSVPPYPTYLQQLQGQATRCNGPRFLEQFLSMTALRMRLHMLHPLYPKAAGLAQAMRICSLPNGHRCARPSGPLAPLDFWPSAWPAPWRRLSPITASHARSPLCGPIPCQRTMVHTVQSQISLTSSVDPTTGQCAHWGPET